mgnify:FL=1|jgi:protein-S-isoprenylcysteine O-methyltransferase Ste14
MSRTWSAVGTAIFLFLAPGTVAGLVPWWISGWRFAPDRMWSGWAPAIVGAVLVVVGLAGLLDSFARFVREGTGTPAPVLPTRRLVVGGLYRHVRNPMYVAVVALIMGQGLILGQAGLLLYGVGIWLVFHAFVLAYEEPTLRRMFPDDYRDYFRHVPRWLPRLRPWPGAATTTPGS